MERTRPNINMLYIMPNINMPAEPSPSRYWQPWQAHNGPRFALGVPNSVHVPLNNKNKQTPWPVVRKRTIPTERPPLVGEVNANFSG
jgi:hypothetical protein